MKFLLPEDAYQSYLTAAIGPADTTIYVNTLPTMTAGYLIIFDVDGVTVLEKIYYAAISSGPNRLTGCVRGLSLVPSAGAYSDAAGTGVIHPSNVKIAMTDCVNYLGNPLSVLNGDTRTGGVLQYPATRTISDPRHVVDKEYADSIGEGAIAQFLVEKNGADPTTTVNIGAGRWIKADQTINSYAGESAVAMTLSKTNYIELDPATGLSSVNQTGFTTGSLPLAIAVCDGSAITSLTDARGFYTLTDGTIDKIRTWGTVQTISHDNLQVTGVPDSDNDGANKKYVDDQSAQAASDAVSGLSYVQPYYILTTPASAINTTNETTLLTKAVAGGTLGTTHAIRGRLAFSQWNVANTSYTVTIRIKYGGTTLATIVLTFVTVTYGSSGIIDFTLLAVGATNAQVFDATLITAGTATIQAVTATAAATAAEDSTASKNLVVTGQSSHADGSCGIVLDHALLYLV
jgi:hypothetical protein